EIAAAPAEQQQRSERQRVAVDDPGDVAEVEPQGPVDRGQSDVHDRHVQDDHELHGRQQDQRARQRRRPPSSAAGRDGGPWCGLGGHWALTSFGVWGLRQAMPVWHYLPYTSNRAIYRLHRDVARPALTER